MKAIDFVVRDNAGGLQRGVVSSEASSHVIQAGAGQEISINLRQADLSGHQRTGNDLVLTTADGRVIMIENYFNASGDANRLFVSADGYLNEVSYVDTGTGELFAQYGPTQEWGKWSPSDDLIYLGRTEVASVGAADDEVSMFAGPLLGGGLLGSGAGVAAAAGGAAVIGGLSGIGGGSSAGGGAAGEGGEGGGGVTGPAAPYVDNADDSTDVGGDDSEPHQVVVTGGGEPGSPVIVTVGEQQVETIIDEDGVFEAVFDGDNFPPDGVYEAEVIVTTEGVDTVLDGPEYVIDTTPPEIEVTSGTQSVDDYFNAEGFDDGVTVTGTGEAGAAVVVTIAGIAQSTTVAADGTWSVTWENGTLDAGEYTSEVTIWTSDAFGNTTTITDMLVVDTVINVTIDTDIIGGDGVINAAEHDDGVTVTGTADAGATVVVTFGTGTQTVTATAQGTWSVVFAAGEVPTGELMATITAVATDAYGNSTGTTGEVQIDTIAPGIVVTSGTQSVDDFFNATSFAEGVTLTGTGEAGASVSVTIAGIAQTTTVTQEGTWSVTWAAGTLVAGEYNTDVQIVTSDAYGNTTTLSDVLVVDTVTDVTIDTDNVEGDGVVNAEERADGVTLTGTAQPGATVMVTFGSGTHQAIVDADGNWTCDFPMSEVPTGEVSATVTAVATDSFGNSSTASGDVAIDTLVRDFGFTGTTGGADGIINIEEALQDLVMTGTTEQGSTVMVSLGSATHAATVAADGTWTVTFASSEIPGGAQTAVMTAVATDAAGNVETITQDVDIDRDAGILTISSAPVEGDDVVNEAEASDGVVLNGTSNPGATVTVTMAGVSHDVTADAAGNWTANFLNSEVAPGVYTADIHATTTDSAGNVLEAIDSVEVDTRVDNLSIHADIVEGDGIINGVERTDGGGVQITGTTEVGSTSVVVTLNGVAVNAVVDANGNWVAEYAASQIAQGTYDADVSVQATDAAGNSATVTDSIHVDTEVVPLNMTETGGGADNVASAAEAATGIDLGGQVEAGATVVVNFDGVDHTATVDAAGNWSLTIPPASIRMGTYDAAIVVTATDMVGNVDTLSDTLAIDTDAPEGPVIASYTRDGDGIRGISTDINDDMLEVHQVNNNGTVTEVDATSVDIPQINETNFQFNNEVPDGSHLVITATDDAGNSSGTYVVLDDESVNSEVSLNSDVLGNYNIETIDLSFAEEGNLTIDEATLLDLSSNTNALQIDGGNDDTVTVTGAVRSGSTVRDGQSYDIYTLGEEGTLYIDDDVTVVI
jgi:hypothetical protein